MLHRRPGPPPLSGSSPLSLSDRFLQNPKPSILSPSPLLSTGSLAGTLIKTGKLNRFGLEEKRTDLHPSHYSIPSSQKRFLREAHQFNSQLRKNYGQRRWKPSLNQHPLLRSRTFPLCTCHRGVGPIWFSILYSSSSRHNSVTMQPQGRCRRCRHWFGKNLSVCSSSRRNHSPMF